MTNKEVYEIYLGIEELRQASSLALPTMVSFALTRNRRKLLPIVEDYENAKNELLIKYGIQDPENQLRYTIPSENQPAFIQESESLNNMNNTDISLTTFKLQDLGNINLTIEQMDILYPMISEGE